MVSCKRCLRIVEESELESNSCRYCKSQQFVPISDLVPNERNPRHMTKAEMNKLKRSLKEFGFVDPIIVNKHESRKNVIIGGHQRVEAAKEVGIVEVPVVYVVLTLERESLLNLALNKISGEWDDAKLYEMLLDIERFPVDLTLSGFDEHVIDEIMARNEEQEKEDLLDVVPAVPEVPKSKPGEVYWLGTNRLMCGDATKPEDVAKLMQDQIADCVWTDHPYGVSYTGTNNPNGRPWGLMKADDLRSDELYQFLYQLSRNYGKYLKPTGAVYVCFANRTQMVFEKALNEAGFRIKQTLIWEKHHVLGHSDYHYSHEPILYCVKEGENCEWYGDRTHKTVILQPELNPEDLTKQELVDVIKRIKEYADVLKEKKDPANEYLHATQKPVSLPRRCIKNNTLPRQLVLDFCAGSGSTLIACESAKRTCYSMEIEPRFTDVIINRWEQFTGQEAVREDGVKWKEIKET